MLKILNQFYSQKTNRTYIYLGIGILILTEITFGFAWTGVFENPILKIISLINFSLAVLNSVYFFINLINENRILKGGISGGITIIFIFFSLLFSMGIMLIFLEVSLLQE